MQTASAVSPGLAHGSRCSETGLGVRSDSSDNPEILQGHNGPKPRRSSPSKRRSRLPLCAGMLCAQSHHTGPLTTGIHGATLRASTMSTRWQRTPILLKPKGWVSVPHRSRNGQCVGQKTNYRWLAGGTEGSLTAERGRKQHRVACGAVHIAAVGQNL